MQSHDPRKVLEDLREHLARHDKPIVFLFGAGTSYSVNIAAKPGPNTAITHTPLIPAIAGLTKECANAVQALGGSFPNAWERLVDECKKSGQDVNIENILSRIRSKIDAVGTDGKLIGLKGDDLAKLGKTIRQRIAGLVNPPDDSIPSKLPHHDFALWVRRTSRQRPIEVFTTNYDVLLERALEDMQVPIFDGFVGSHRPFFHAETLYRDELSPGPRWLRLWKVHGSVNWTVINKNGNQRIIRTSPQAEGEMILPSHRKYDESRKQPYLALSEHLGRVLDQDDVLLVTVGFAFLDQHVNSIIFSALDSRPRAHMFALQHSDPLPDSLLIVEATKRKNVLVLAHAMR